jgi:glycosyltransferase involved in cell wall biosynthesis
MKISGKVKRIAILWEDVTGYVQAALRALLAIDGVELFVMQRARYPHTQFGQFSSERCEFISLDQLPPDDTVWLERLLSFAPELAIITSTKDSRYWKAARLINRQGGLNLLASDIPPRPFWRDSYGIILGRLGKIKDFHAALVPGSAAARYAVRIGFAEGKIFQGLYSCDTGLYRPVGLLRHSQADNTSWPRVFLFVGQFIERKGLDCLLKAYQRYRQRSADPWELWCVGAGPLRHLLEGQAGVRILDFLSPGKLKEVMAQSGVFILPSHWDHWGIVLHEAVCSGLPVIASRTCFGTIELVQDGYNGFTFPAGDSQHLSYLLQLAADEQLARQMGKNSLHLSWRFDPQIFSWLVLEHIPSLLRAQNEFEH